MGESHLETVISLRHRSVVITGLLAAVSLAMGCGQPTDVTQPAEPTLHLIGGNVTDTIDAEATLQVKVTDDFGQSRSGVIVRLASIRMHLLGATAFGVRTDTTDADGVVVQPLQLSSGAGPATVEVTVPAYGLSAAAHYVVNPGKGATVRVGPADTSIYVDGIAQFRGEVLDRNGNRRTDPVSLTPASGPLAGSSSAGTVRGTAIGRGVVTAVAGALTGQAFVSVVPRGEIVAVVGRGTFDPVRPSVARLQLDGSGLTELYRLGVNEADNPIMLTWNPEGTRVLFQSVGRRLTTITLDGAADRLVQATTSVRSEGWGQYSRDGQWVYYSVDLAQQNSALWRVRADGTNPEQIEPDPSYYRINAFPSPSPDGGRLAFLTSDITFTHHLAVFDINTRGATDLGLVAEAPRWSPTAEDIAYVSQLELHLIHSDGAGDRRLSTEQFRGGVDWDPTGRYLIARTVSGYLALVDASAGTVLPLAWSGSYVTAAWRP